MPANPIQQILELHAAGRFTEMEKRARAVLKSASGVAVLHELLGISLSAQKKHAAALEHLNKAVRMQPADAQFWENLGISQREVGKLADAETSLRRALALRPNSPETLNALGSLLIATERSEEARTLLERALQLKPSLLDAALNLAKLHFEAKRHSEVIDMLRKVVPFHPSDLHVNLYLGNALYLEGNVLEAEPYFRRAIEIDPKHGGAWLNLALVLGVKMHQEERAIAAETALELWGGSDLEVSKDNERTVEQLASILSESGRSETALRLNLKLLDFNRTSERVGWAFTTARAACMWDVADALEPELKTGVSLNNTGDVFAQILSASATTAEQLVCCRAASRIIVAPTINRSPRAPSPRIKIGYLSGDFREHAISHLIAGVIENHDRNRFEVLAYDFSPRDGTDFRGRMERAFDRMVDIRHLSNLDAAQAIADEGTDILIDLVGWTMGARPAVLAARPAPVQMYWLGVAGTTGASWIDYNVADQIVIPPRLEPDFSEQIIRLPNSYLPANRENWQGEPMPRDAYGLPETGIVFCSFCSAFKITRSIFATWMRLLSNVAKSVLWLPPINPAAEKSLRAVASENGVDPTRLIVAPRLESRTDHILRVSRADIALDTFPYGAHTTASDMLLAGLPLVALTGETFASRVSTSVLEAAGLPEFATSNLKDYESLALRLGTDRDFLEAAKAKARASRASPLFDVRRFTRDLETAFTMAWDRHRAGLPPEAFDVPR